jgi:hypothetical protein
MPSGEQKFGILQIELTPMREGIYATVTTEAAIPVCGILGRSLEKTFQECATEKYFKNVPAARTTAPNRESFLASMNTSEHPAIPSLHSTRKFG